MLAARGDDAHHHFRYQLDVEIEPVDMRVVRDALEDEPFGLRERYGPEEIERQLQDFGLRFNTSSTDRWSDFDADIEILSVYLSQYIVGYEIEVSPTAGAPKLTAWKIVGCRGETVRLDAEVQWDHRNDEVVIGEEDVDRLADRWADLPEWLRNAMRLKHPRFRAL